MRVILMGAGGRAGVLEEVAHLRPQIGQCAEIVAEDFYGEKDFSSVQADLAIVFGGDGSILRATHQMGTRQIPIIAVHLGTLAFLAGVYPYELIELLKMPNLLKLPVVSHLLLSCTVKKGSETLIADRISLNEICVQGNDFRLLQVELHIDGEPVTTYRCDGLMLSTPIGSTARNLSAGGPILRNDLDAVVISPISPHTLSHRPAVDSADRHYSLHVLHTPASLVIDGVVIAKIVPGDTVEVKRADVTFKTLEIPGHSYYRTLREKLGWSGGFQNIRGD